MGTGSPPYRCAPKGFESLDKDDLRNAATYYGREVDETKFAGHYGRENLDLLRGGYKNALNFDMGLY